MTRVSPSILRIVAPYAAFSALWILISDSVLEAVLTDKAAFAQASMYKGWFFIAVTSALLYVLMR